MKRLGAILTLLLLAVLPVFARAGPKSGELIRADYGSGNSWVDVTERVRSLIHGDSLNFRVDNNTLGVDPRPREVKVLRLQIQDRKGRTRQLTFREKEYVNLRINRGGSPYAGGSGRLQILRADYGSSNRFSDVTARLNSQIQGDQLNLRVTNYTMGGDPAQGQDKTLRVQYAYNGRQGQMVVNEGDYLRLPDGSASYQGRLQILRADYGSSSRFSDVTARLNSQIQGDQLNLRVSNYTMGGDPAQGQDKTLRVQYAYNGRQSQMVVNEGGTLNLPDDNAPSASQTIRCESNNNARNYCPVDTRGGVRLSRQINGSVCTQGSTWGYDNRGVWVDNGCRGEFQVSSPFGADVSPTPYGTYSTIPRGTQLAIRTNEVIDSKTATVGQVFSAVTYGDVLNSSGGVVIPKGSDVELVIRSTAGSDLVLDMDSLVVAGRRYVVSTGDLEQKGGPGVGANRRTAEMVGGGAAVGAIIGAIVGGGKGAAIGAGVGAAGGAGVEVLTKGREVRVPAETVLNFRLDTDLRLQPARWWAPASGIESQQGPYDR